MCIESRIKKLKNKISKLKYSDVLFKIFFSSKPKYNPTKISEDDIMKFENKHEILLPYQFRLFLLEIGYGAGPYNGIFSLDKMVNELAEWKNILNCKSYIRNDFELTNADALELIENKRANENLYSYKQLSSLNGLLPIATEGCTYFFFIVLNGEQKGKIWSINIDGFNSLPAGVTQEYDFLSWYEKWYLT